MNSYYRNINIASLVILTITVLFLPFSTAGLEIGGYLSIVLFLIGGQWQEKWDLIKSSRLIQVALTLFLYICIRIIDTQGTLHSAFREVGAYDKLLLIPVAMWIISRFPNWQTKLIWFFITAITITVLCGYLKYYGHVHFPIGDKADLPAAVFIGHITSSYFTSIAIMFLLIQVFTLFKANKPWQNALYIMLLILLSHYLLFMTIGRSGLVTLLFMGLYFLCRQVISQKQYLPAFILVICVAIAGGLAIKYSKTLNARWHQGYNQVTAYQKGHIASSWGNRINFWINSAQLMKDAPIIGHGTGSMKATYKKLSQKIKKIDPTVNPFNQYLFFGVEQGIIGALLYIGLLYLIGRNKYNIKNEAHSKLMLEVLTIGFAVGCMYNSWLHDVHEGYLFVLLAGILSPTKKLQQET